MRKFFHLALAVCFFINSFPTVSVAQSVSSAAIETNVRAAVEEEEDSLDAKLRAEYAQLKAEMEKSANPQKIVQIRRKLDKKNIQIKAEKSSSHVRTEKISQSQEQKPDALRTVPPVFSQPQKRFGENSASFLTGVENGSISFADLIEYADPLEDPTAPTEKRIPRDLRIIVYAAEIIGNTLDSISEKGAKKEDQEVDSLLLQIQPRLLFQLCRLETESVYSPSDNSGFPQRDARLERIMAIGTLRITLLKIQRYYERIGVKNPIHFVSSKEPKNLSEKIVTWEENKQPNFNFMLKGYSFGDPQKEIKWDPYQHMFDTMVGELNGRRNVLAEEGTEEYGYLMIAAEYATYYAVLYDPSQLKKIVDIFDRNDPVNGNFNHFKRRFSAVENTIFTTMFETVRFSPIRSGASEQMLQLFKDFSDPQKYSISTRVFALEAGSLMFRSFNKEFLNGRQLPNHLFILNNITPKKQDKDFFAQSIASIYCSLKNAKWNQFGLDSSEMEALSNKLADMYNNVYDISSKWAVVHTPGTEARPEYPKTPCEITITGNFNKRVRNVEVMGGILTFVGESILWAYVGGPVFAALGNAFRATRGAIAVLPRATRAASAAQGLGNKWSSFSMVVRKGAQGANFVENAAKNGIEIFETVAAPATERTAATTATHTVSSIATGAETAGSQGVATVTESAVPGVVSGAGGKLPQSLVLRRVGSTRQLLGKPAHFSWDNLMGRELSSPVATYAKQTAADGTVSYFKLVENSFRNLSYDEFSPNLFVPFQGSSLGLNMNLSFAQQQTVAAITRGRNILTLGAKSGALDAYVPLQNGTFWNLSWGKPLVDEVGFQTGAKTVYLLPHNTFPALKVAGRKVFEPLAEKQLTAAGAVETSLQDVVSGEWVNTAFSHYFQPTDWGSPTVNALMPRFTLTKEGANAFTNPSFAANMLKYQMISSPLVQTMAFFGFLKGVDYGIGAPLANAYFTSIAQEDAEELRAKTASSLVKDPVGEKIAAAESSAAKQSGAEMSAYQLVSSSGRVSKDGLNLILPTVIVRRVLAKKLGIGSFNTINGQTEVSFRRRQMMVPFYQAINEQNQEIRKKINEISASEQKDFEEDLDKTMEALYQEYWMTELLKKDPSAKMKMSLAAEEYRENIIAIFSDKKISPDQRLGVLKKESERFFKRIESVKSPVDDEFLAQGFSQELDMCFPQEGYDGDRVAYNDLWLQIMFGYQEAFVEENPNLSAYPELSDSVRKTLDDYLDAQEALFDEKDGEVRQAKQTELSVRLGEDLARFHKEYVKLEKKSASK